MENNLWKDVKDKSLNIKKTNNKKNNAFKLPIYAY